MKSQKFKKKLSLTKNTIANLNGRDLQKLNGGYADTYYFECADTIEEHSCETECASCPKTYCCPPR